MTWWLPARRWSPSEIPAASLAHPSYGGRAQDRELPRCSRTAVRDLVGETEAYLAGRAEAPSREVPVWLPMSMLAHGDRACLGDLARPERFPAEWEAGVAYLAIEILSLAPDDRALRALQRGALIPLELDLLGRRTTPPRRISQLVDLVLAALRQYYHVPH
jgi:hypothetical protein